MDLLKVYDYKISYHPRKVNVVVNALSRKSSYFVVQLMVSELQSLTTVQDLSLDTSDNGAYIARLHIQSYFIQRITDAQSRDPQIMKQR